MKKTLLALAFSALCAFGADVTGKWSGSFVRMRDGQTRDSTALLDLKQTGNTLTGSVGPNEDQRFPIKTGSIEGNKISLEADDNGRLIKFELVVDGDRIKGDAKATNPEGETMTAKLDVTRQK